jgi:hypothetical protein
VQQADMSLHARAPSCWTAQVLDAFQGLQRDTFVQAVKQGAPISLQYFADDLRHRLRGVWRDLKVPDQQNSHRKLEMYQAVFCSAL